MLNIRTVSMQAMNVKKGDGRDTETNKTINLSELRACSGHFKDSVTDCAGEIKSQLSL